MSNSTALESLTATYTDSEGEEGRSDEDNEQNSNGDNNSCSPSNPDCKIISLPSSPSVASVRITSKFAKLVSYHDDTVISEDENDETDENAQTNEVILMTDENQNPEEELSEDGVTIPPEPPGNCSADLQDKISKYYEKMKNEKLDLSAFIEKRKDFRNPSIYEKLLQFCAINELGKLILIIFKIAYYFQKVSYS